MAGEVELHVRDDMKKRHLFRRRRGEEKCRGKES